MECHYHQRNDQNQIRDALKKANEEKSRPTLIIGKTIMGKGARNEAGESFEAKISTHGMPLSEAGGSFSKTVLNLGGDPENPFTIFSDVAEYYKAVREKKIKEASLRKQQQLQWEKENPELKAKWDQFWSSSTQYRLGFD